MFKKFRFKSLGIVLGIAMAAAMLAACGQDSGSTSTASLPSLPSGNAPVTATPPTGTPALPSASPSASTPPAATNYVQGVHYRLASQPQPVSVADGQIEVIDFFWYGCPHCNVFEPLVRNWKANLPEDVQVVHLPATWGGGGPPGLIHARAYYTALQLGISEQVHRPFFDEIHSRNNPMNTVERVRSLFTGHGVSAADFDAAWNSFTVSTAVQRAEQIATRLQLVGTPMMVVNGKWVISISNSVDHQEMLRIADYLIERERAEMAL